MYISAMEVRVLYRSLVTTCHASYIVRILCELFLRKFFTCVVG